MISVVMPAKNAARFLQEALDSIDAQGDYPLEILVVDDHSSDETASIAASHPRTRVLKLESGSGPSAARNLGIREAKGELIAFLDADDLWTPNKLKLQTGRMRSQPDLEMVTGRAQTFCRSGAKLPQTKFENDEQDAPLLLFGGALLKKSLVDRVGPIDETLRFGEDSDFFFRILETGAPCLLLRDRVLRYRIHGGNMTTGVDLGRVSLPPVLLRRAKRLREMGQNKGRQWSEIDEFHEPRISVIVPAFNEEKRVARAIESILSQSLKPHEVIVVDDGSTDKTAAIAQAFGKPVRLIQQPNQGACVAKNTGLDQATGNQLAFLDADDVWKPGKLESQWKVLTSSPFPDLVFGQIEQYVDETNRFIRKQPGMSVVCLLATKSAFDLVGKFRTDLATGELIDWLARAQDLGLRSTIIEDVVAERRQRPDSMMGTNPENTRAYLRAIKDSLDRRRQ